MSKLTDLYSSNSSAKKSESDKYVEEPLTFEELDYIYDNIVKEMDKIKICI